MNGHALAIRSSTSSWAWPRSGTLRWLFLALLCVLLINVGYFSLLKQPSLAPHASAARPRSRSSSQAQQQLGIGVAPYRRAFARATDDAKGLHADLAHVAPGGADAELVCIDHAKDCEIRDCKDTEVAQHLCKATCASCEGLKAAVQAGTAMQIRIVHALSSCINLHPHCQQWQQGGKCTKEPHVMLQLCQASCSFCAVARQTQHADSGQQTHAAGTDASAKGTAAVACEDDISVCPYLASSGMCAANSTSTAWMATQCRRSCKVCTAPHTGPGDYQQLASLGQLQQPGACWDYHAECPQWAQGHGCQRSPEFMQLHCASSCGACRGHQQPSQEVQGVASKERRGPAAQGAITLGEDGSGNSSGSIATAGMNGAEVDGIMPSAGRLAATGSTSPGMSTGGVQGDASQDWGFAAEQQQDPDANQVDLSDVDVYSVDTYAGNELPGLHRPLVDPHPLTPPPRPQVATHQHLLPAPRLDGTWSSDEEVVLHGWMAAVDDDVLGPRELPMLRMARQPCEDKESSCAKWKSQDQCNFNPEYMARSCPASCNNCQVLWLGDPVAAFQLRSGFTIPTIGFGTAGMGNDTQKAVLEALAAGYRLIDTAEAPEWYREADVGAALGASNISRDSLFIITKVHPRDFGAEATVKAVASSLQNLRAPYLDLVLLHYYSCWVGLAGCKPGDEQERPGATWREAWRALEMLQRAGTIRSIGVSNFNVQELQELLTFASVAPSALEARCDPFDCPPHLVGAALQSGLAFIAYSPLGAQWAMGRSDGKKAVLEHPVIVEWARRLQRSPAQVVLKWALQRGTIVIPASRNSGHIKENLQLLDFVLPTAAMRDINALEGHKPSDNVAQQPVEQEDSDQVGAAGHAADRGRAGPSANANSSRTTFVGAGVVTAERVEPDPY